MGLLDIFWGIRQREQTEAAAAARTAELEDEVKQLRRELAATKAMRTKARNKSAKEYELRREAMRALKHQSGEHRAETERLQAACDFHVNEAQSLRKKLADSAEEQGSAAVYGSLLLFISDALTALGRGYGIWCQPYAGTVRTHDDLIALVKAIRENGIGPRVWQEVAAEPINWAALDHRRPTEPATH